MISTHNLSDLPNIENLQNLLQSLGMLDAIISPEWQYRYYSFNANWAINQKLASMRDGSGNHFYALFTSFGCLLKGFNHEAPMSPFLKEAHTIWDGVLDTLPHEFKDCLKENALVSQETTFCIWRLYTDNSWKTGEIKFISEEDPDGSKELLSILNADPRQYQSWAEEYYETLLPIKSINDIYQHQPLTKKIIRSLNHTISIQTAIADAKEIAYPLHSILCL